VLYDLLKPLMRMSVRVFYRIQVEGKHNIPHNKPVIVAPNHPNAFMDAIVVAVHTKQQLHFLVRSDVFSTPVKRFFLGQLNQIPIYRIQEGADNLHKNEETFVQCNKILSQNKTVLIFPEGLCVQERRLRKLKKGLARIVFGAESSMDNRMDLLVIPIGVNYENPKKFRSRLLLTYGEPIHVSDYIKQYQKEPARTVNEFTRDVEEAMAKLLTVIPDKENDKLVEQVEEVYKKDLTLSKGLDPGNLQHDMKVANDIAAAVEHFRKHEPARTEQFSDKISDYLRELRSLDLRDHLLKPSHIENMSFGRSLTEFLAVWFGMPLHLYGLINNYLPWKLAYNTANKVTRNVEFHSSVNVAAGTFMFLAWWAALTLTVALTSCSWYVLAAYIISLPLSAWFNIRFWPYYKKAMGKWRLFSYVRKQRSKVERLIHTRMEIVDELDAAREEYNKVKSAPKDLNFSVN
jgi:glycerol-3-phosphate O-acyltransferase/dihydroxyacetone phosphate acyltransferase